MIDLRKHIRHLPSQENVECCTASATLIALEMITTMHSRTMHFSRLYTYYMTRKMQGRLNKKGAELLSTIESIKQYGVCKEETWPFRLNRVDIEPSINAVQEAAYYRILDYKSVDTSSFNFLLDNNIPIVIGMFTGRLFWKLKGPLQEQRYIPINNTDNRSSQAHAVCIVGYNEHSWIIANSFGPKWGFRGYGIIPFECARDIGEAYAIINFAGMSVGSFFQQIDK